MVRSHPIKTFIADKQTIATGKVPDILKLAEVLSLHKIKDCSTMNDYRPNSLLPKVVETIVHKRVYDFLNNTPFSISINMV